MINVYSKSINPTQLLINNNHQDFLKFMWKTCETMKEFMWKACETMKE